MRKLWNLVWGFVVVCIIVFFMLATFRPPASFSEASWLGVVNHWLLDADWEEELGEDNYILSKSSLTDDSLILAISCGLKTPTLAVVIFSAPTEAPLSENIQLSFDKGPYFKESWSISNKPNVVGHGGDLAMLLLRRILTSNILRVKIEGRGTLQDEFKFYLDALRKFDAQLKKYCRLSA
jgi:hypothetical protein